MIALVFLGATAGAWSADKKGAAPAMNDSIVDPAALNFSDGRWGTCINGQTFQQEALVSLNGFQYAGYFADGGVPCLARRALPKGAWQVIRFTDYPPITHQDVHNVVSISACRGDGTLHMAFDHHCQPLHYRRSIPGLASNPAAHAWQADSFGPVTSHLEAGRTLPNVTYPQFFSTPDGRLQVLYRLGSSGDGDWYLAEYSPVAGAWTTLGMLFARVGNYETSASRCAYPNPPRYSAAGRLHITWCWRERPADQPFDLRTNHDLCHTYSDDFGRTWRSGDGRIVATLAGTRDGTPASISITSPGVIARSTRFLWGQMNTTTEFVDARGRVHVINWQQQQDAPTGSKDLNTWRYYHYWRSTDGQWHENLLPFHGRKPQLVLDAAGTAYVVFCKGQDLNYHGQDAGGRMTIVAASEGSQWTDWKTVWETERLFVGEPLLDHARWREEGVLSIYTQEKPAETAAPSALHVMDWTPPGVP